MDKYLSFSNKSAGKKLIQFWQKKNAGKKKLIVVISEKNQGGGNIKKILREIKIAGMNGTRDIEFINSDVARIGNISRYIRAAEIAGFLSAVFFSKGKLLSSQALFEVVAQAKFLTRKIIVDVMRGVSKNEILLARSHGIDLIGNVILKPATIGDVVGSVSRLMKTGVKQFIVAPPLAYFCEDANEISSKSGRLSVAAINTVLVALKKKGVPMHINLLPACILDKRLFGDIKFSKGGGRFRVISEDGRSSFLARVIADLLHSVHTCSKCCLFPICDGVPAYLEAENSVSGIAVWCMADLHTENSIIRKVNTILKDAKKCGWSLAFSLGDFVEGDKGVTAWKSYIAALKRAGLVGKIMHITGNHEFSYHKNKPDLRYYKKYISPLLPKTVMRGNIAFIPLHHKPSGKNMTDYSHTLTGREFNRLRKELIGVKNKIRIVLSHQNPSSLFVKNRNTSVLETIPKEIHPDVWIFGHTKPEVRSSILRSPSLLFCPPAAHEQKSLFLALPNGKKELYVIVRNHTTGAFKKRTVVRLSKRIML